MGSGYLPDYKKIITNPAGDVDLVVNPDGSINVVGGASASFPSSVKGPSANYWDVQHLPAANTQATATKAAAGNGVRNVCTGFTVTIASGATAPAAANLSVAVIDGASGGVNYLWRTTISIPAAAGAIVSFVRSDIWLVGSPDTSMTIEFSASGGINTLESVTMEGTTVTE